MSGFWSEAPCMGCGAKLNTTDPCARLCPDCTEEVLERMAARVDRAYDRAAMNDAGRLWQALWRLYGAPDGWRDERPPWEDWRPG